MTPPDNPAGDYRPNPTPTTAERQASVDALASLPTEVRAAVAGLSDADLDTVYKNWTVRKIVHHLADSHVHLLIRFKLALTEETPRINPYNESTTAEMADSTLPIEPSLQLLDGVHARLTHLLRTMTDADFARGYFHPEHGRVLSLGEAAGSYAWHGRRHAAQIRWVRQNRLSK